MFIAIRFLRMGAYWLRYRMGSERGATAVEYGIMVALIAALIIVAVTILGQQVNNAFCSVVNALPFGPGPGACAGDGGGDGDGDGG